MGLCGVEEAGQAVWFYKMLKMLAWLSLILENVEEAGHTVSDFRKC